ncbi:hypothetical protein MYCTH_2054177 [Thermothelomyces thermophilus ATCC 42464]|uniref:Uncharacterized protein n=1 Tax=Thermothelomyces thermophilus (strain ATCC 42464 / BCRC 31852 / DSM 1799) TaxID=573729 RepID=G2Q1C4_THET4|nr:uncharacterized protein MYCTH_2054177 [Thermothelomyces thermophilus ATCC 42464]AEO53316.1 hypothetical protein MYCTH_2054177 [Thermothelomyces thermophilus ATCC 42464]
MANRIRKKSKSKPATSTLYTNYLLTAILSSDSLLTIRPCSPYKSKGLSSYEVSKADSSRYAEYVRNKRSNCNVLGYQKLKDELIAAKEQVLRLWKQKRIWFKKMIRAIARGIDSVEELERVEREEAAAAAVAEASRVTTSSSTLSCLSADFG